MTTSYLLVTKWRGADIISYPPGDDTVRPLIRKVQAQGSKARKLAELYALQLNGGVDYNLATGLGNLKQALRNDFEYFTVCAIPDSQAREYSSYLSWENCEVFSP